MIKDLILKNRSYRRFFEEKIKSVTELFRVMLDMRKEIIKNTKDEFELYGQRLYDLAEEIETLLAEIEENESDL